MLRQLSFATGTELSGAAARPWYAYLLWVAAAAVLGFAISAIFAGLLRLPRAWLLLPYLLLGGGFIYAYVRWSGLDVAELVRHNWVWGVVGAVLIGAFLVRNVLTQPASPHATGLGLAFDLAWSGVVYGALDAIFLSVVPVLATWQAFSSLGWTASWPGKIGVGALALLASLLVTICYHAGYPEYRNGTMGGPVVGNGVMSLGYLLAANPITAVASHIAMHVTAVLHGPATTVQLPPHY